jgi:hypothetical protein
MSQLYSKYRTFLEDSESRNTAAARVLQSLMADDLVGDQPGAEWMMAAVRRREASSLQRRQLAVGFGLPSTLTLSALS